MEPDNLVVTGVSAGGEVVTGYYRAGRVPNWGSYNHQFRWSVEQGFETLEPVYEDQYVNMDWASGVSADGSTIVGAQMPIGTGYLFATMWHDAVPSEPFDPLPAGYLDAGPAVVSEDGSKVWGWISPRGISDPPDFFEWTAENGMTPILAPYPGSQFVDVAPETGIILARTGQIEGYDDGWPVYLIFSDETEVLPQYLDTAFTPTGLSANGRVVVGDARSEAVMWMNGIGYVRARRAGCATCSGSTSARGSCGRLRPCRRLGT